VTELFFECRSRWVPSQPGTLTLNFASDKSTRGNAPIVWNNFGAFEGEENIEVPSVSSSEHFVKLRTFVFSATHFVRVLMDDVVVALSSNLARIK
jgi:hypothetical protein